MTNKQYTCKLGSHRGDDRLSPNFVSDGDEFGRRRSPILTIYVFIDHETYFGWATNDQNFFSYWSPKIRRIKAMRLIYTFWKWDYQYTYLRNVFTQQLLIIT